MVSKSRGALRVRAAGGAEASLSFSPPRLDLLPPGGAAGAQPLLSWNAGQRLTVEHLREKEEGDPEGWWGESFRTHHDTKPRGPEGVAFDLAFPGVNHVYGLPQHATDLALRPTRGPEGALTGECVCVVCVCVGGVGGAGWCVRAGRLPACLCNLGVRSTTTPPRPHPPTHPSHHSPCTPPHLSTPMHTEPYRLYNLDVFEYLPDSPFGLYGSIPFLAAHREGRTLGAFWLNAAEMYVDVERTPGGTATHWLAGGWVGGRGGGRMGGWGVDGWACTGAAWALHHPHHPPPTRPPTHPPTPMSRSRGGGPVPAAGALPRRRGLAVRLADGGHSAAPDVCARIPPVPLELQGRSR